jgi:hypothetical protein
MAVRHLLGRAVAQSADAGLEPPVVEHLAAVAAEFHAGGGAHQERTADYFTWRYLANPLWKYEIATRYTEGRAVAYLVTRATVLKGFPTLAVADIGWRRGYARAGRTLLVDALRRGAGNGLALGAALVSLGHPAFPLFVRSGFLPGPHRFRFLLRTFQEPMREALRRARWALMWGDTDHL